MWIRLLCWLGSMSLRRSQLGNSSSAVRSSWAQARCASALPPSRAHHHHQLPCQTVTRQHTSSRRMCMCARSERCCEASPRHPPKLAHLFPYPICGYPTCATLCATARVHARWPQICVRVFSMCTGMHSLGHGWPSTRSRYVVGSIGRSGMGVAGKG